MWWWKQVRSRGMEKEVAELYHMSKEEIEARNDYLEKLPTPKHHERGQATDERRRKLFHETHDVETTMTHQKYPAQAYAGCAFQCCARCRLRREEVSKAGEARKRASAPCDLYKWHKDQPEKLWRPRQGYWIRARRLGCESFVAERFHMTKAEVRERNRRADQKELTQGQQKPTKKRCRRDVE